MPTFARDLLAKRFAFDWGEPVMAVLPPFSITASLMAIESYHDGGVCGAMYFLAETTRSAAEHH